MKIKPTANRLLLELDLGPDVTPSGLIVVELPDADGDPKVRGARGKVLETGPLVQDVRVGDYVVADKYYGVRLPKYQFGGRDLMLIKESFIAFILERDDL